MVPVENLEAAKTEDDKKKAIPKLNRPVDKWVWHPFENEARCDGL